MSGPAIAVMTDLWPSRSEPHNGPFVRELHVRLARSRRQVVLVPRLLLPGPHWRIWGENVQGWQTGLEQPPGLRVLRYPIARLPKAGETAARTLGARLALRRGRERPALVHAHFLYAVAPAAVRLARSLGAPVLLTAHGTDVRWLDERRAEIPPRYHAAMVDACRRADGVTVVAGWMKEPLIALGVPEERIIVAPMGVDEAVFHPADRDETRAALGVPLEDRIVLFVGRATPAKGSEVLAAALRLLGSRVRGYVAGPSGLDGCTNLGMLDAATLARWVVAADLVCLPSFAEGMPVSVSEALASGTPVVASAVGGLLTQIEPGVNGLLVPPGDIGALAEAIVAVLERGWEPQAIRATSRPFWWSTVSSIFEEQYARLLGAAA